MRQKLVTVSDEIQRLNDVLGKLKAENDQLKAQSRTIPEYESRVTIMSEKIVTYERQI